MTKPSSSGRAFLLLTTLFLVAAAIACSGFQKSEEDFVPPTPKDGIRETPVAAAATQRPASSPTPASTAAAQSTPPANGGAPVEGTRIAFFGDNGASSSSRAVLQLVKNEMPGLLVILGDFDYDDNPAQFERQLTDALGSDFPIVAVVGNHDVDRWSGYRQNFTNRLARTPSVSCDGDYGVNMACNFNGVFLVLTGVGTLGTGHVPFITQQLSDNNSLWSVCGWHKNQTAMQVGDKGNEVGWGAYEACRTGGALILSGHEHSYERTKTLSSMQNQTVDSAWPDPNVLRVGGGSTFAAVVGLGGESIRDQNRCRPTSYPYGCNGEWAKIYTSNQGARPGALFIDFGVDGDPAKAHGYFKNVNGEVVDDFTITTQNP